MVDRKSIKILGESHKKYLKKAWNVLGKSPIKYSEKANKNYLEKAQIST